MEAQFTATALPDIPSIEPGYDLAALVLRGMSRAGIQFENGDLIALAQKAVSKAEDRFVHLEEISPSPEAIRLAGETQKDPRLVEVILQESRSVLRTRPGLIVVEHRLGFVCANAGVDHSNVGRGKDRDDWVLRLPIDPDRTARKLRSELERLTGRRIGVLIVDSHGRAWRLGTVGVAIGLSGLPGLLDLRGRPDLYGNPLLVTQVGLADEVAAAVSVIMGQADEGRPIVHVRGLPYELREGSLKELLRPVDEDLFR